MLPLLFDNRDFLSAFVSQINDMLIMIEVIVLKVSINGHLTSVISVEIKKELIKTETIKKNFYHAMVEE